MATVSLFMALAVFCLVIGLTSSAPLQVMKQDRDRDVAEVAAEKLMNTLQLLVNKKAEALAIQQLKRHVSDQGKLGVTLPSWLNLRELRKYFSPMMKAARRHFHVSEPGTGPILNHPLTTNTGTKKFNKKTVLALINQLFSSN